VVAGEDTMKSTIAAGIVGLSLIAGVGVAYAIDAAQTDQQAGPARGSDTSPSATPRITTAGPIRPGVVVPIAAGMTVADALATGYVEPDKGRGEACAGDFYRWTEPNKDGLDLITHDGVISSIGIHSSRYRTADGIGVGSRLSEVKAAYPTGRIEMVSDYGQPGILIRDGVRWLGLLFGEVTPKTLNDSSMVTFAEVTSGVRAGLLRDGC